MPEKEEKKQYTEAANLNRANTQGDIYPFANTMVFQNVTRASESLWPLRRKKYVHDTLEHNARYIRTQTKSTSESILYNTPVLDLMCKNRTTWEYMEEAERVSLWIPVTAVTLKSKRLWLIQKHTIWPFTTFPATLHWSQWAERLKTVSLTA